MSKQSRIDYNLNFINVVLWDPNSVRHCCLGAQPHFGGGGGSGAGWWRRAAGWGFAQDCSTTITSWHILQRLNMMVKTIKSRKSPIQKATRFKSPVICGSFSEKFLVASSMLINEDCVK